MSRVLSLAWTLLPFAMVGAGVHLLLGLGPCLISIGLMLWLDDLIPDPVPALRDRSERR